MTSSSDDGDHGTGILGCQVQLLSQLGVHVNVEGVELFRPVKGDVYFMFTKKYGSL